MVVEHDRWESTRFSGYVFDGKEENTNVGHVTRHKFAICDEVWLNFTDGDSFDKIKAVVVGINLLPNGLQYSVEWRDDRAIRGMNFFEFQLTSTED